jgi:predicted NUDIX family NTP pyrophosphohydrolase
VLKIKFMPKHSAGILLFRRINISPEVFLVHPGGPFWINKDQGAWSVPKGEFTGDEEPLAAAIREFKEETGLSLSGDFLKLTPVKQKGGKIVHVYALEHDPDITRLTSNTFTVEWPPKSGKMQEFPEVDRYGWFDLAIAREKLNEAQGILLDELMKKSKER